MPPTPGTPWGGDPTPLLNKWNSLHLEFPYQLYSSWATYVYHDGTLQLPVAVAEDGSTQPSEIIQAASPYGRLEVQWEVARLGAKPMIPNPRPSVVGRYSSESAITVHNPVLVDNGDDYLFVVTGVYVWYFDVPPSTSGQLNMGTSPVTVDAREVFFIGPEDYTDYLLPSTPGSGLGSGPTKPR